MERQIASLPSAIDRIEELRTRLDGRPVVVFLDFDGTLTAIVDHPDHAVLSSSMREAIEGLAKSRRVAIVSGRDRGDIETLVGIDGLIYAGNHGFDISGAGTAGLEHQVGAVYRAEVGAMGAALESQLAAVSGAIVEVKSMSVAVHYRMVADADLENVERAVAAVRAAHPDFKMMTGKKVYEMLPPIDWDKGRAVLWLLDAMKMNGNGVVPVYIGDDVTDEAAFKAIDGRGITVCVARPDGERSVTEAEFRVDDTAAVERLLHAFV